MRLKEIEGEPRKRYFRRAYWSEGSIAYMSPGGIWIYKGSMGGTSSLSSDNKRGMDYYECDKNGIKIKPLVDKSLHMIDMTNRRKEKLWAINRRLKKDIKDEATRKTKLAETV